MMGDNRQRSFLALMLMVSQAFFFNAVFFTYALVVKKFFHASNDDLPRYLLPFAVGSFLGPMVLGPLFDKIGRKPMITATYGIAGLLLLGTVYPFSQGMIGPRGMGIVFTVIFFVASSAASAAYLTVSEIFPLEIRAFAIAGFLLFGDLRRWSRRALCSLVSSLPAARALEWAWDICWGDCSWWRQRCANTSSESKQRVSRSRPSPRRYKARSNQRCLN